ncbi:carboxypeptidase-like regulatory domain-containing protein [Microvirga sp. STR05]|uniref:Carboxypeptidase-like regulatory domain-containing protein n=1 Tax=Hymenobacter duratus TaxID=2771356 RepID=A0ABR8JE10_9BACT|nr:carboxypeptidase-like regulatory domain-containing protein [Hymenobacter duratus]MBD2713590.1 carboxypeptidase-like regulatory domain-containing protein [Hymenobacter duratus]MBR7948492.1 carboxypeptidase-like regulatory domain-containing protein [Microvirga sp. STR05]
MPRPVSLTVPRPCHESWQSMTPTAQGRHCATCNKVVLDFTQKTDAEILALLRRAAAPCGRFRPDQLGRPLLPLPAPAPRWRTWLAAAAVLGLREVAAEDSWGQPSAAVYSPRLISRDEQKAALLPQRQAAAAPADTTVVRGRVTDKATGQGLPGVTVMVPGTTIGVATSVDGTFELNIPGRTAAQVSYSFVGYVTQVMSLEQAATHPTVQLEADVKGLMGELVVVVAGGVRS